MKIELDVDPGQLGKSLVDIMGSLTEEERRTLARNALETWLRDPGDIERSTRERWAIDQVKAQSRGDFREVKTDEEAKNSYRYGEFMRGWKSSKEQMVDKITAEILEHYKTEVTKVVREDPKVLAMQAEVVKIMMETFPKIAHDAMTVFVAEQFRSMLDATHTLKTRVDGMQASTEVVAQRLMHVAAQVGLRG